MLLLPGPPRLARLSVPTRRRPQRRPGDLAQRPRATRRAPAANFTGFVQVERFYQANAPARALGAHGGVQPGARTDWHTHPPGQTLMVTTAYDVSSAGVGPLAEVRPGDDGGPGCRAGRIKRSSRASQHSPRAKPLPPPPLGRFGAESLEFSFLYASQLRVRAIANRPAYRESCKVLGS